jgi:predicted secreted protein
MAARGGRKRDNLARRQARVKQGRSAKVRERESPRVICSVSGHARPARTVPRARRVHRRRHFARDPVHPGSRTFMTRLLIFTLAAACALAACNRGPRVSDPAKTIRAPVGEAFQVSLKDVPGAGGARWQLVDSARRAPLVLVDSAHWMSRLSRRAVGARGTRSWTFRSRHKGTAMVSLVYAPPGWTEPIRDTTRFRVVIE